MSRTIHSGAFVSKKESSYRVSFYNKYQNDSSFYQIHDIFEEYTSEDITRDTVISSLGLDSLDMLEIIMRLEEEFGRQVKQSEYSNFNTIGDIVEYVDEEVSFSESKENDLTFTGELPVLINNNGEASDIYAPVRTSSCDINMITDGVLDDLYTAKKDEVCVKIEKTGYDVIQERTFDSMPWAHKKELDPKGEDGVISPNSGTPYIAFFNYYRSSSIHPYMTMLHGQFRYWDDDEKKYNLGSPHWYRYDQDSQQWIYDSRFDNMGSTSTTPVSLVQLGDRLAKVEYYYGNYRYTYFDDYNNRFATSDFGARYVDLNGETHAFTYAMNVENTFVIPWSDDRNDTYFVGSFGQANHCNFLRWNRTTQEWNELPSPEFEDGSQYFGIRGDVRFRRMEDYHTPQDQILYICNGLEDPDEGTTSNWIVKLVLDGTDNAHFEKYAKIPDNVDIDAVFGQWRSIMAKDNDGRILFLTDNSEWLYTGITVNRNAMPIFRNNWWGPTTNFEGLFWNNPDPVSQFVITAHFDYKDHIITKDIKVPIDDKLIWEGYATPNVYSQELKPHYNEVSMTAIDPISIMKYVNIDKIMTKPNVVSYGDLIGRALAYVKLENDILEIEDTVRYDDEVAAFTHLLTMQCQVSNFWDEAGEPSTLYEMISEMLRPFCLTMAFDGEKYIIYDTNRVNENETRTFDVYRITDDGHLIYQNDRQEKISDDIWRYERGEWKSNNTTPASLEISQTYDKVTGVASTSIPSYSTMAFDLVDVNERDKYDIFYLNIQRNKSKGYPKDIYGNYGKNVDNKNYWYYLWNGVYANPDYYLIPNNGVKGYSNITGAWAYFNDQRPAFDTSVLGSVLNFYGGDVNAIGTGKEQEQEKSVEVKKCITVYAPDNGVAPEFLENDDLEWLFDSNYDYASEGYRSNPVLTKPDATDSKFGRNLDFGHNNQRIAYHQEYPNMTLLSGHDQIFDLTLSQAYSRTGINQEIDVMDNNTCYDKLFCLHDWDQYYAWTLDTAKVNYFPDMWNAKNIYVKAPYFDKYSAGFRGTSEVWDKRRINLYFRLTDGTVYQFNGKEWVQDTEPKWENAFYLVKLMNGEKLFHNDMRYDLIEVAGNEDVRNRTFSLTDEKFVYFTDRNGAVAESGTRHEYEIYAKEGEDRLKWINDCSEGNISIILPAVNAVNVSVFCDVYNGTMLGCTGTESSRRSMRNDALSFRYTLKGTGRIRGDQTEDPDRRFDLTPDMFEPGLYGNIFSQSLEEFDCMPVNLAYVKAEHLDLSMEVSVPKSNLGQMFGESDIKYTIDKSQDYLEEFSGPGFRVNTYHPIVSASYSYLIYNNDMAQAGKFIFREKINARPEAFTVQAYINWLCKIRKIYGKTMLVNVKGKKFNNISTYLTTPEIGTHKLMVVSDSWDLKSDRHSITAIEDYDMQVESMDQINVVEIPRRARNERYNLPSVKK